MYVYYFVTRYLMPKL